jgi:hypothetical protein
MPVWNKNNKYVWIPYFIIWCRPFILIDCIISSISRHEQILQINFLNYKTLRNKTYLCIKQLGWSILIITSWRLYIYITYL